MTKLVSQFRGRLCGLALLAVGLCASAWLTRALAQQPVEGPAASPGTAPAAVEEPLAARQQIVRDRLVQLEDRMYRLIEKLGKTEPDQARRLEQALRESGELLIRRHMDQAVQALERSELADAAEHQAAAEKALEHVLVLLTETGNDALDRQREMDRMNELREQVDKLLEKQIQLRGRSDASEHLAERLAAAAERLRDIIERQNRQNELNKPGSPAEPAEQARSQSKLREETESLTDDLDPPSPQPQGDPLGHAAEQARRDLQDAADRMRAAEQGLGEGKSEQSQRSQQQAAESLRKALESLEKAAENAKPLESGDASSQQRELEKQAGKLADEMKEPSGEREGEQPGRAEQSPGSQPAESQPSESQPGESQPGEQDTESSSSPPTPGGDNIRKAQQHMKKAGQKLESQQPSEATPEQEEAIKELEQARAELQETLDQLRREQQEEVLAGLEQRFRAMLIEQQAINATTLELDGRKDEWTRSDSLNLAALAGKQTALSGEAAKALNILIEEGTSVVFPQIVEQVRDDMADAGKRIGDKQTGAVTRSIQDQIVEALQELIAAIEQRHKDGPPPPGNQQQAGGEGGEQGETPLLPGSAELKLLRSCQVRVNKQTQSLAGEDGRPPPDAAERAGRLSSRQEELADMARKMSERAGGR